MKTYAVITGDITDFTRLENERREELIGDTDELIKKWVKRPQDAAIFRGDSFQLLFDDLEVAVLRCIQLVCWFRKQAEKESPGLGARIAVGIGGLAFQGKTVLDSDGEAFHLSGRNFDTMELINLDPDKTEFSSTGDILTEYDDKEYGISKDDVIILFDTVREKSGKGYSALKPLKSQIDNILDAQRAKGIQIQNSGITLISPKAATAQNQVDEGINAIVHPDNPNHITQKQQIENKLSGRGLENRYIVSSKGLDASNLGSQLNAVNFDDIEEADKLSICSAFGVDVELTPYGKNATFDNKQQAELSIVQKEATPLMENLINSLVSVFPGKGNPNVSFAHLDCMSIIEKRIQETNTVRITQVTTLLGSGLIDDKKGKELLKDIIG